MTIAPLQTSYSPAGDVAPNRAALDNGSRSFADLALAVAVPALAKRAIGFTFRHPMVAGAVVVALFVFGGRSHSRSM